MEKRILVVSSANMDFVMNMHTIPSAGQTIIDNGTYRYVPGGKGANSAVAIRRLGGDCVFCTRLGNDANGVLLNNLYKKEGIDTRFIAKDEQNATGLAAIMVEDNGVNRIVVYPGANLCITPDDIDNAMTCYPDALFMQLEIDPEAIIYAANCAHKAGIPIFIDAGPANKNFPLDRLPPLEVFSPNETETEIFTGISPNSPENCLRAAIALSKIVNARYYVIKLGGRGVYIYDGLYYHCLPTYDVKVVDTTAAGDAFTAAFTLEYLRSGDIERAGKYGNAVGSLAVSRAGAYTSLPTESEVAEFLKQRNIKL